MLCLRPRCLDRTLCRSSFLIFTSSLHSCVCDIHFARCYASTDDVCLSNLTHLQQVVELEGYVIILVEGRDGKIKLYGSPADRDGLEVADEILDVNERKLDDVPRAMVIKHIHEVIINSINFEYNFFFSMLFYPLDIIRILKNQQIWSFNTPRIVWEPKSPLQLVCEI